MDARFAPPGTPQRALPTLRREASRNRATLFRFCCGKAVLGNARRGEWIWITQQRSYGMPGRRFLEDCGVGDVRRWLSSQGFSQRSLDRVGSLTSVVSGCGFLGQHNQVVSQHG